MCPPSREETEQTEITIRKLAGLQAIIPQFDNLSAVTPRFFIESVETMTSLAKCTPAEKLLIMRSRIRGDALTNIINSPDLNQETDYGKFKDKFLSFFETNYSLGARQQQFSNCKMLPNEQVKIYAAKVALATQHFFNDPDLTNQAIKTIFEKTKLAKFIEGLLPKYKQSIILKDPTNFDEAVEFVLVLQANESSLNASELEHSVNNTIAQNSSCDIAAMIEAHASHTKEMINGLSKEIEQLKVQSQTSIPRRYSQNFQRSFQNNYSVRNNFQPRRNFPPCRFCTKQSHTSENCYSNPANKINFRSRGQNSFRPHNTGHSTGHLPFREYKERNSFQPRGRGQALHRRPQTGREFQKEPLN